MQTSIATAMVQPYTVSRIKPVQVTPQQQSPLEIPQADSFTPSTAQTRSGVNFRKLGIWSSIALLLSGGLVACGEKGVKEASPTVAQAAETATSKLTNKAIGLSEEATNLLTKIDGDTNLTPIELYQRKDWEHSPDYPIIADLPENEKTNLGERMGKTTGCRINGKLYQLYFKNGIGETISFADKGSCEAKRHEFIQAVFDGYSRQKLTPNSEIIIAQEKKGSPYSLDYSQIKSNPTSTTIDLNPENREPEASPSPEIGLLEKQHERIDNAFN